MVVHEYFRDKYEEYRLKSGGLLFEFGLTNTYVYPWEILKRLKLGVDIQLFQNCLGCLISDIFVNDNMCGIAPRNFLDRLISDPDLANNKTIIGKEWAKMCTEELSAIKID